jgi:hypothetical protein
MFGARFDETRFLELVVLPSVTRPPDTRPIRRFHPRWLYCRVRNACEQPIFVYGPRHSFDQTTLPTSLFVLPAGDFTPKRWDCKGVLIPSDRSLIQGSTIIRGPVALKYRDMRRIRITEAAGQYKCPRSNGIMEPGQIDFAVPTMPYLELLNLPRHLVAL